MSQIEAMKLALEALELFERAGLATLKNNQAITALRQAIEQAQKQDKFCDANCVWTDHHPDCVRAEPEWYHGVDAHGCNRFYHRTEARPHEISTPLYLRQAIEQDQTSCYCPNCEALSKQLEQAQKQEPVTPFGLPLFWDAPAPLPDGSLINEGTKNIEQEPVEMYRRKCADGSRCLHGCHTNEPCYTTPPQRKPKFKEFIEWAGSEGYDCAQTCNSDTGEWICLNPMTADLWKAWQAAHGIKGEA